MPVLIAGILAAVVLTSVPSSVRALAVTALAMGMLDAHVAARRESPAPPDARTTRLTATLLDAQLQPGNRYQTTLRLEDGTHATLSLPAPVAAIGTRFVLRAKREPFDDARNPGEPSPRELEAERGNRWHLAHAHVLASGGPDAHDPTLWIARSRAWASQRLHAELGEPDATILAGALWGERGALPADLRAEFQDTGTVHVLVTAGLHLGVVAALAFTTLRTLGCGRVRSSL